MTTLEDFKRAIAAYRTQVFVVCGITFALMLLGGFGALAFLGPIRQYLYGQFGESWGGALLGGVPWIPALFAMFFGVWRVECWAKVDGRLLCPACRKNVAALSTTVIASRNCPLCGKRVLAEP